MPTEVTSTHLPYSFSARRKKVLSHYPAQTY